jgi:hypothetical protein
MYPDYDNMIGLYIDAGSGGQANAIHDYLMRNWKDQNGEHFGLIDKEYAAEDARDFPEARNKIRMCNPSAMKADFYEALIQMVDEDHLKFTADYDNKGYLTLMDSTEQVEEQIAHDAEEESAKDGTSVSKKMAEKRVENTKLYRLSLEEEAALINIDVGKEQVVSMVRNKRASGRDSFDLAPEKAHIMHKRLCHCGIRHKPQCKSGLIDLEAQRWATGRKGNSQRERLSDRTPC